jgi:pimeloyl-ACP methyl ester carboxylesterase
MRTILLSVALVLSLASCAEAEKRPAAPAQARAVSFTTADGVELKGRVHGTGPTAVVLSNMGDNNISEWEGFAPALAARGFTVLSYSYRYTSGRFTAADANASVADLTAAIAHVRQGGATKVVLIGASLGGMAASKVAGGAQVTAVVLMASRLDLSDFGFTVSEGELAAMTMPKLVLTSDADNTTAPALTREVYDRAPQPKAFHSYPGSAHGTRLFQTEHKADLEQRLIDFVEPSPR